MYIHTLTYNYSDTKMPGQYGKVISGEKSEKVRLYSLRNKHYKCTPTYTVTSDPFALVKEKEAERLRKLQANPQKMARMKKIMDAYLQANKESSDDEETQKRLESCLFITFKL